MIQLLHTGTFQEKRKKEVRRSINLTFRYTYGVLSLDTLKIKFGDFVDHINTFELKIKNTSARFASYLELHLEIDSED
jgi:cytochrome c peroxidase